MKTLSFYNWKKDTRGSSPFHLILVRSPLILNVCVYRTKMRTTARMSLMRKFSPFQFVAWHETKIKSSVVSICCNHFLWIWIFYDFCILILDFPIYTMQKCIKWNFYNDITTFIRWMTIMRNDYLPFCVLYTFRVNEHFFHWMPGCEKKPIVS